MLNEFTSLLIGVKIIWYDISQELIDKLINSIPARLEAVIKNKGGAIPY